MHCLKQTSGESAESHNKLQKYSSLMKDTSIKHTIKDKLLLNATAVSVFKKVLQ